MREALFDPGAFGPRAALRQEGRLVELLEDRSAEEVTDALFLARVTRVEPRLNAAFLDYGEGKDGYLVAKDARHLRGVSEKRPIQHLVREGERLIVQGIREADADKGPRFTTDIRLFGLLVIYRPNGAAPAVSRHARGRRRAELRERAHRLFPEGHVTLRRFAAEVPDEFLIREAEELAERWRRLRAMAEERRQPGRLDSEDGLQALLRRVTEHLPATMRVADAALHARLRRALRALPAEIRPKLVRETAGSLFRDAGVEAEIEEALSPVVELRGGGRIVIQETLACTAIDVDGDASDPLSLDLRAAAEIARQVRLRNLGGTIIVDFVDLRKPGEKKRLEEALRSAFREDPQPVQIHPLSPLGIAQISRPKRGASLSARYRRSCRCCRGSGLEPSLEARTEQLFETLRQEQGRSWRLFAAPDLAAHLERFRSLPWLSGIPVIPEPDLPPGRFRLENAS